MKPNKKVFFPIGILFFLFIFLSLFSLSGAGYYIYINLKKDIDKIADETRTYSVTLINAHAQIASASSKNKKNKLDSLFKENKKNKLFNKAFYVLKDGKIISHSDLDEAKRLNWNIATDEFMYNLDQILLPINQKSNEALFLDYYLYNIKIPFNKIQLKYLKTYLNNDLDRNGWLVTKAVKSKNKFIGTVNFLIAKTSIYNLILDTVKYSIKISVIILGSSFIFSFLFSLIIFIRYRSIQKRSQKSQKNTYSEKTYNNVIEYPGKKIADKPKIKIYEEKSINRNEQIEILDAIPISNKREIK